MKLAAETTGGVVGTDMGPLETSPFASLTLIAAPAMLTNASSVLVLSTSNRFARAIDRARSLSAQLEAGRDPEDPLTTFKLKQLDRIERRALLLLYSLRLFYLALGAFAGATLTSLLGAALTDSRHGMAFRAAIAISAVLGVMGVGGLVLGCVVLVRETRIAVTNISEEAQLLRKRYGVDRLIGD